MLYVKIRNILLQSNTKYCRITLVNIQERNERNMKKRWLSLAVTFLMVFALISQGITPVLAEKGIAIGQPEEQLNIEADEASNIEEELLIGAQAVGMTM